MRICMVMSTPFPPEEGIGNYVWNLSKEYKKRGHQVTIITRGAFDRTSYDFCDGIEVYRVRFFPCYPFHVHVHGAFVDRVVRDIEKKVDIFHLNSPLTPALKTSRPVLTTFHSPLRSNVRQIKSFSFFSSLVKMQLLVSENIERDLIAKSNMVSAVSESVALDLAEYGLDPSIIPVTKNGVDHHLFFPKEEVRRDNPYLLYTGRLAPGKGLFDLLESMKVIASKHPKVRLYIVGRGPFEKKLREMTERLGLGNSVRFFGLVDKSTLIKLYQGAKIFVFPSHYEGLPTSVLEAMACGLPIVATAAPGVTDAVENGKTGLLVPVGDSKKLSEAIDTLLTNDNLVRQLGKEARREIEKVYSWPRIASNVLEMYQTLIHDRGG